MFEINPKAVYTPEDLIKLTGESKTSVYEWYKDGLEYRKTASGRYTTGRALNDFFESNVTKAEVEKTPMLDLKTRNKIKQLEITLGRK